MHVVPVVFDSRLLYARVQRGFFDVVAHEDAIEINGGMSTGDVGWQLSAVATRRRSRITVSIIASRDGLVEHDPGMEDHAYSARLEPLRPGSYSVTVRHVFRSAPGEGPAQSIIVLECDVRIE